MTEGEASRTIGRVAVPPLPDQLLVPLLDAAGDVLRSLESVDRPAALRKLADFDPRGLRTEAARQQLWRALESDEPFRDQVVEEFRERSEVVAALESWSAEDVFRQVEDAADRADLPLLASALYAARPRGWAFGLGAAATIVERQRLEKEEDEERKARAGEIAALDEARRRAEEARDAAQAEAIRLGRELRDERHGRRDREAEGERAVAEAGARADELEAALARARAAVEAADGRIQREAERSRELEQELRTAKGSLAESERARVEAVDRLERSAAPGSGLRYADLQALTEAADLAQRLATGLGGVAERARGVRPPEAPARDAETAPLSSAEDPSRRMQPRVPPGMVADSPEALAAVLRSTRVVLVVDGYNVSMLGWSDADIADQREAVGAALERLHTRTRCDVTLVFDGAGIEGVRQPRRPGVRVVFSAPGEEADQVVVREVGALPNKIPVVVASSDAEVRADAEREGALVVSSATLLSVLRS
ncbi:MAG: NYN domain-containing protein [Actinomycetota bacterium]